MVHTCNLREKSSLPYINPSKTWQKCEKSEENGTCPNPAILRAKHLLSYINPRKSCPNSQKSEENGRCVNCLYFCKKLRKCNIFAKSVILVENVKSLFSLDFATKT